MTDYYCRGRVRIIFVVMMLVFGGAFVAFFLAPGSNTSAAQYASQWLLMKSPLGLLFGGAFCVGLVGLLNTFTVYRLDENGIVKRWWNGAAQEFAWKDLVNAEPTSDGSGTLTDFHGNRMSIPSSEYGYHSKSGGSLHAALAERLASVPEAVKAQMEKPREFRFGQSAPAIAAGAMVILCLSLAVVMPILPYSGPPAPLGYKIGMSGFFVFSALFMAYLGLQQTTRVYMLSDTSLTDRSLFGRREIPFDQVVSVTTRDMQTKAGVIEVTTVKSAKTTISFPSRLPNYDRLVQAIRDQVGARVVENEPQVVAKETKQFVLQNVIGLVIIGCLFGLALGGLAMTGLHDGQAALQRQIDLDTRGKTVSGKVIGTDTSGSKSTTYSLNYSFEVDGKTYSHASTVSRATYDQEQIGDSVGVVYLPNDPEVSRAAVSIAKERAEEKMRAARMMLAFACGLPILFAVIAITQKPRYHPTPARNGSR